MGRPFDKFFNQQESECPVSNPRVFDAHCREFAFAEKADGTCIQFWWCPPTTLEAVHQTMLRRASAAALPANETGDDEEEEEEEQSEVYEERDDEEQSEAIPASAEGTQHQQGLGKASLIEKRARRFKKVLPRVLQPSMEAGDVEGIEPPKHVRGIVRKPQAYHVRAEIK